MNWKELLRDFIAFAVFIALIVLFENKLDKNKTALGIAFLFFIIQNVIIMVHERRYKKNFPYKPYRIKKGIGDRILIGFIAGFHYLFFIGTYNHKKYNTQAWYPETLECVFGNISEMILAFAYFFISVILFRAINYYSIIFMVLPAMTDLMSILKIQYHN